MILEELKIPRLKWLAVYGWFINGYSVRNLDYGDRSYAIRKCQDEPACKSLTYYSPGAGYLKSLDMTISTALQSSSSYEHFQPYYEGEFIRILHHSLYFDWRYSLLQRACPNSRVVYGVAIGCSLSLNCSGSKSRLGMWDSCQWLGVRRWFSWALWFPPPLTTGKSRVSRNVQKRHHMIQFQYNCHKIIQRIGNQWLQKGSS